MEKCASKYFRLCSINTPVQAARPVASAPYPAYQSHQAPPDYTYRQPDPPQPTTTPQTYQVYSDMVSFPLLLLSFSLL
ncbi:hypothetical protein XENOCAPTIV_017346, partial [Xenoophorus captivus]